MGKQILVSMLKVIYVQVLYQSKSALLCAAKPCVGGRKMHRLTCCNSGLFLQWKAQTERALQNDPSFKNCLIA